MCRPYVHSGTVYSGCIPFYSIPFSQGSCTQTVFGRLFLRNRSFKKLLRKIIIIIISFINNETMIQQNNTKSLKTLLQENE